MSFNLSDLFERVAETVPDREALVTPTRRLTYASLDERATRLAHHLRSRGIGAGDHVGLQLLNGTEYVEAMLACFKLRAVPVNVNYRYVERELGHLFDNADLAALVCHRQFLPRVAAVRAAVPALRLVLAVDDGTAGTGRDEGPGYEDALAAAPTHRDFPDRSGEDLYLAYTGGTTGLPKGVMWRHEDLFFGALGGGDPLLDKGPITSPDQLPDRVAPFPLVQLCAPPLMHVSAHWGAFNAFFGGGKVVLLSPGTFDPTEAWDAVGTEGVNTVTVVGDAMARPLLDALEADPARHRTDSLLVFASGGAVLSEATKAQIRRVLPNVIILDTFGSSETGVAGTRSLATGDGGGAGVEGAGGSGAARFSVDERTAVLDDDLRPVDPGSGVVGRLARRGRVPLGYYKDAEKTAATFVVVDGERWVLPGDMATVDADGTVVLLGRGSGSINTGGEKVFPEEVEAVLRSHPAVYDAVVVGVPDERWGQRVVAVVQARPGAAVTLEELQDHARRDLAGYKVPRDLRLVDSIPRTPQGKPDYAAIGGQAAGS